MGGDSAHVNIICFDWDEDGTHDLIGEARCTVKDLSMKVSQQQIGLQTIILASGHFSEVMLRRVSSCRLSIPRSKEDWVTTTLVPSMWTSVR